MRVLEWICRLIVGGVFIYAAVSKILVPCELAKDMYLYHIAPGSLINIGAIILPYVEIILGICLIAGIAPRGSALGLSLVLLFFIVLLSVNLIRGVDFECGCFGDPETDICNVISLKYKDANPDIDRITFVRVRTACDIVRDIILLGFSGLGLGLIIRRQNDNSR